MIAVETDGDVRTVTLDRPARRNALRGTGSAFCAGADLDAVAREVAASDAAALHAVKTRLRDDADRETRERRERAAFGDLWEGFER
jgi:enoyl-CoA hydratase/carnithine racemase